MLYECCRFSVMDQKNEGIPVIMQCLITVSKMCVLSYLGFFFAIILSKQNFLNHYFELAWSFSDNMTGSCTSKADSHIIYFAIIPLVISEF